ncbi:MAG: hypothetical protein GC162_04930 [Planctomycetes bacterium]|nr:hypothetical protein [Planctomycetota bacterium]
MIIFHRTLLMAGLVIAMGGSSARALPLDCDLAQSGGRSPFSDRAGVIPTLWDVFANHSLSVNTGPDVTDINAMNPSDLAEPGRGNPNHELLGQIVRFGRPDGVDRPLWAIVDRWVMIDHPYLLYFDFQHDTHPFVEHHEQQPLEREIHGFFAPSQDGHQPNSPAALTVFSMPVPEPGAMGVMVILIAIASLRRPRPKPVHM